MSFFTLLFLYLAPSYHQHLPRCVALLKLIMECSPVTIFEVNPPANELKHGVDFLSLLLKILAQLPDTGGYQQVRRPLGFASVAHPSRVPVVEEEEDGVRLRPRLSQWAPERAVDQPVKPGVAGSLEHLVDGEEEPGEVTDLAKVLGGGGLGLPVERLEAHAIVVVEDDDIVPHVDRDHGTLYLELVLPPLARLAQEIAHQRPSPPHKVALGGGGPAPRVEELASIIPGRHPLLPDEL